MLVFDKVVESDRRIPPDTSAAPELTSPTALPNGETVSLLPSVKDAFSVFEDLCLLTNRERPHFLKLESLPMTFSLELIESVLTNYHELFRQASKTPCFIFFQTLIYTSAKRIIVTVATSLVPNTSKVTLSQIFVPVDAQIHPSCIPPAQTIHCRT